MGKIVRSNRRQLICLDFHFSPSMSPSLSPPVIQDFYFSEKFLALGMSQFRASTLADSSMKTRGKSLSTCRFLRRCESSHGFWPPCTTASKRCVEELLSPFKDNPCSKKQKEKEPYPFVEEGRGLPKLWPARGEGHRV